MILFQPRTLLPGSYTPAKTRETRHFSDTTTKHKPKIAEIATKNGIRRICLRNLALLNTFGRKGFFRPRGEGNNSILPNFSVLPLHFCSYLT
jgi:hypothetical protein